MKYFVIFSLVIFLGVMAWLDLLKYLIDSSYFVGLRVVPVVMVAEFFFGVFFNLSLWYKLTDRTIWGTWFSILGLVMTVGLNILLVPRIGYMGCAWAAFACYGTMMVASYLVGRRHYPIPYDVRSCTLYFIGSIAAYGLMLLIPSGIGTVPVIAARTLIVALFALAVMKRERLTPARLIPPALRSRLMRRR